MAYDWNSLFGTLATSGELAKKELTLDQIKTVADQYHAYHCSTHNDSRYVTWDVTYNGSLKGSHDSTYKSYNSYNSGKLSSNYSGYNSSVRRSNLVANSTFS